MTPSTSSHFDLTQDDKDTILIALGYYIAGAQVAGHVNDEQLGHWKQLLTKLGVTNPEQYL